MTRAAEKLTGLWCDNVRLGFGVQLFACFAREAPTPVGFVWGFLFGAGNAKKRRFEVMGSYVIPWARRKGVRTAINRAILEHCEAITTQNGSKSGGLSFMRAAGYNLDRMSGVWSLAKRGRR